MMENDHILFMKNSISDLAENFDLWLFVHVLQFWINSAKKLVKTFVYFKLYVQVVADDYVSSYVLQFLNL